MGIATLSSTEMLFSSAPPWKLMPVRRRKAFRSSSLIA
jgi:hypothetical protein